MNEFNIYDKVIINNSSGLVGTIVNVKYDTFYQSLVYVVRVGKYEASFQGSKLSRYYPEEYLVG